MKIAVHGLGRMGMQIVRKLAEDGHEVIAHNRSAEPIDEAVGHGAVAAYTKDDVLAAFAASPAVVWIMLPAEITDDEVAEWTALLPQHSIIINGGNSNFLSTQSLNRLVAAANMDLIDIGVSGGVWGYNQGFPMMVGGDNKDAVTTIAPVLDTLKKPGGAWSHFGPSGAGHYVKMVHNAIEYGMMQALAEGFAIMKKSDFDLDLRKVAELYNHGSVIESSLVGWLKQGFELYGENLETVAEKISHSGEGEWTVNAGKELGIPAPIIEGSLKFRIDSEKNPSYTNKLVNVQRNMFGGHKDAVAEKK